MKKTYLILMSSIMIVTFMMLLATVVFAWFLAMRGKSFAAFESGQIIVDVSIDEALITETINIADLAFVDFSSDIIINEDGVLNKLASTSFIQITNDALSSDVKNIITLQNQSDGLFYLLYYEGKNLDSSLKNQDVDWYSIITTTIGSEVNEMTQRSLLNDYNAFVLTSISNVMLSPGDYISLQIAIWGDYDMLLDASTYLTDSYSLQISIATTQWEGAL